MAEQYDKEEQEITAERLLLALLDDQPTAAVLEACGANTLRLRARLKTYIEQRIGSSPTKEKKINQEIQQILQQLMAQKESAGGVEIVGIDLLLALFDQPNSQAVVFLKEEGVSRLSILNYVSQDLSKSGWKGVGVEKAQFDEERMGGRQMMSRERGNAEGGGSILEQCTINLNEKALSGKVEPLIGRSEELQRTIQVLSRRRKHNPLYVGEAGVGKTSMAEGLAKMIVDGKVPEQLHSSVVYMLNVGWLVAGTKYRGDFEKRMKVLFENLKQLENPILFIDEIHTIIGAGSTSGKEGSAFDFATFLKLLLNSGDIKCMGSTTYQEYHNIFEKDRALARRFQKIDIVEPTVDESIAILTGLKERFERHHNIQYSEEALRASVELSDRYINDRHLPDKAIDVLDEAGAFHALLPTKERSGTVEKSDIEQVVARMARIPASNVSSEDKTVLKNLEHDLQAVIYGQDRAISVLVAAITLARSGLRGGNKPIGCFLFAGPTGVGKTEVAVQLSNLLKIELLRFDMSEYAERHTISRLLGAPPGYVGHDQGGLLTDAVLKHPHAVVLMDEIEKAHPEIYNVLLQVMDYGKLTDSSGREIDFRHTIIIMTSNAGASEMSKRSIGFAEQDCLSDSMGAIKRAFTPEFRNRLDDIIQFAALDMATVAFVVDKFIGELEQQLNEKGVTLKVSKAARQWFAENGYDEQMGARPMARLLQEKLKKPLANELLFGRLESGGCIKVKVLQGDIEIEFEELALH